MIEGCLEGKCATMTGCTECLPGYYLDEGRCKSCSSVMSGCKQCRSSDVCTMCASEFLTIDDGRCICRVGEPNQFTNPDTGACECFEGYYMTNTGCQTCDYMIPGCDDCVIDSSNTGLPLFGAAQFLDSQMYLRCNSCGYGRYV